MGKEGGVGADRRCRKRDIQCPPLIFDRRRPAILAGRRELIHRKKPNMKKLNLHVWFCPVFYGLTLVQRMALGGNLKAATRAKAGRFVGSHGPTIYVYVPEERKIRRVSYTKVWFMEAEYTEKTDMSALLKEGQGG